jgi:hypothetical protein
MNPQANSQQSRWSRHRVLLLISASVLVIVIAIVFALFMVPSYRHEFPAAWGEECLGGPEVIDDALTETRFSPVSIQHGESQGQQWYSCSWTSEDESRYTLDIEVSVLDGKKYDGLDVDIQGVRDSDTESLEADDIVGFDSGYCTSEINVEQFRCYAVDSNLRVKIMVTGGGTDGMPPGLGVSLEEYLADVGADVRAQLAR